MESESSESSVMAVTKLILAADHYASVCPGISRFYMQEAEKIKEHLAIVRTSTSQICQFCNTLWRPENNRISFCRRMRFNKSVKKLLKKSNEGRRLGKMQLKFLSFYNNGKNRHVINCCVCNKRTVIPAADRPLKIIKKTKFIVKGDKIMKRVKTKIPINNTLNLVRKKLKIPKEQNKKMMIESKKSLIDGFREKFGLGNLKTKQKDNSLTRLRLLEQK